MVMMMMIMMMIKMIMRSGVDMSLSCEGQILTTSDWLSPIYQMTLCEYGDDDYDDIDYYDVLGLIMKIKVIWMIWMIMTIF